MNTHNSAFLKKLSPYSGVLYFVILLIVSHFFWKFTVLGDDSDNRVTFFGLNLSGLFIFMSAHVAEATTALLHFFGINAQLEPFNIIRHDNGQAVRIVWSCTGLKQAYIFMCIIAFYRGSTLHKLWFIPTGLLVVYAFNIMRIAMISAITRNHPDWFDFLHEELFKYLFYAVIFGMWFFWEEKIVPLNKIKPLDNQQ